MTDVYQIEAHEADEPRPYTYDSYYESAEATQQAIAEIIRESYLDLGEYRSPDDMSPEEAIAISTDAFGCLYSVRTLRPASSNL